MPEPEVFVLLKLLILPRRKDQAKRQKDVSTARALGEFLLKKDDSRSRMQDLFKELPKGWQKKIRSVSLDHFTTLLDVIGDD